MKKPPDSPNYRTIKVPLKKVLKHFDIIQPKFEESVLRVNQFATIGYEFLKLYVLHLFENKVELPKMNKALITKIFNLIGQGSNKGRKCIVLSDTITTFYNDIFSKIYPDKLNSSHLSYVLPVLNDEMLRCFETNIKTHFLKYLCKYINVLIRYPLVDAVKNSKLSKEERKVQYQGINKEIRDIKNDVITMKIEKSNEKYHQFIKDTISLFPKDSIKKNNLIYNVKASPQKYILASLQLNKKIEEQGKKCYQVFCQRSNYVPKTITLNTSGVIEVINDTKNEIYGIGYSQMNNNAKRYQKQAWREILKLENKQLFNHRDYIFYNQIQTDGVSANILFIRKEFYNKTYGQRLPQYDEVIEFEIKQLEKLTKDECEKYKQMKLVGIDPGKKDIITMVDEDGNYYSYSNCRRRNDTYLKRSNQILLVEKKKNGIIETETKLSSFNKRTLDVDKFEKYLLTKQSCTTTLREFYEKPLFRKLNLRRFCKTKSSEDKMLNEIGKKFGKNLLLGLGDWSVNSSYQMKGCMPTPNKGIAKLLKKRFEVISIDEYNTSKLYNRDLSKELTNVKVKRGKKSKSIHTLLTPTRNPNGVILNRDRNACKNILLIMKEFLQTQKRKAEFSRKQIVDS